MLTLPLKKESYGPYDGSVPAPEPTGDTESTGRTSMGGVLDMEVMVHKLLILHNFRRHISTSGTPPIP